MFATSRFEGENSPPLTAVLFMVPAAVGVATISTSAEPPLGRSPSSQMTSFSGLTLHDPWLGVAETAVRPDAGKKSLSPTCWAAE